MRGITFDNSHSYNDFGLTIAYRDIGNPSKVKIKERVPFSNIDYDFSNIYGGQEYTERQLTYGFNVIGWNGSKDSLVSKKIEVLNWLMRVNEKSKLYDDTIEGFYFLAEVEDAIDITENEADGTLNVVFTAYPFKISKYFEGNDIWDEFNFLLDYAQVTTYEINGSQSITLYNNGAGAIKPTIIASAPMVINVGGNVFNIPVGQSNSYDLMLTNLETNMTITGNGSIEFRFRKEMI